MLLAEAIDPVNAGDPVDAFTNKLGGLPIWPSDTFEPPIEWSYCRHCKGSMLMIMQIYTPLDSSPYDRFFYVFACDSPQCCSRTDSWRVIRAHKFDLDQLKKHRAVLAARQKKSTLKSSSLFDPNSWACKAGSMVNDDDVESKGLESLNSLLDKLDIEAIEPPITAATVESQVTVLESKGQVPLIQPLISKSSQSWSKTMKTYPAYFMDVFDDSGLSKDPKEDYSHEIDLLKKYQQEQGLGDESESAAGSSAEWSSEAYEKLGLSVQSKVFKNFQKTVQLCPTQVLRYEFKGAPLFYAEDKELAAGNIPKCPRCHRQRVFEFQLMPAILSILPANQVIMNEEKKRFVYGLDFGTVIVYTCSSNCDKKSMEYDTIEKCDTLLQQLEAGDSPITFHEELAIAQVE